MQRILAAITCALAMGLGGCASQSRSSYVPPPIPVVTMGDYQAVQPGMTIEEVNRIVGFPGQEISSAMMQGVPGLTPATTITTYKWANVNGSLLMLVFSNGVLQTKTQSGLR